LQALEGAGVRISLAEIDSGPGSIESAFESTVAAPGTIAKILAAEREGVDAVVIDCMGDPGMHAAREVVRIPVVGPGETSMHVAAMLGHKFSVVTVLRRLRSSFENEAAVYGLASKLASVRSVDIPVLDLESDIEVTRAMLVAEAHKAIEEDGAEAIVFGCTGLMGCATAVREGLLKIGLDVPVIDPIPTAVSMAATLVRVGLSHSKLTYPLPPRKRLLGYEYIQLDEVLNAAE
jgi:allantoin racemase